MQTFLPYDNFKESVKALDNKRLNRQRLEVFTILRLLNNQSKSKVLQNHPAVLMWKSYDEALKLYLNCCIKELENRGYINNMEYAKINLTNLKIPKWFGDYFIHKSHRQALLFKDYKYYKLKFNKDVPKMKYAWPSTHE